MKSMLQPILMILCFLSIHVHADVPRTLYAINSSAETVSKLNLESKTITQNIAQTGQVPNKIMAHDDMIYILDSGTSDIKILDPRTDDIVRTIALAPGANPWDMEFVGLNRVYVSNWVANTVSVVDMGSGEIIQEIPVGKGPQDILILDSQAFVTNTGYAGWGVPYEQGTVHIIDVLTDTVVDTIPVPTNPQNAALAPDGRLHVLCTGDYAEAMGRVAVIAFNAGPNGNIPAMVDTIELGGSPGDLEITPSGKAYAIAWGDETNGFLYAYDALSGTVHHNVDNPILVGPNTGQVLYDGREDCLWIPFMKIWGGDGYVQKFDVAQDSVVWVSGVLGNGTQNITIMERIRAGIADATEPGITPDDFIVLQNYPNPFNPRTTLRIDLPASGIVSVDIFSASGQWITTLVNTRLDAGSHAVLWEGMNHENQPVSSGVYWARLKFGEQIKTVKMTLLR